MVFISLSTNAIYSTQYGRITAPFAFFGTLNHHPAQYIDNYLKWFFRGFINTYRK